MKAKKWLKVGGFVFCAAVFAWIASNLQSEALQTLDLSVTHALAAIRQPAVSLIMRGATALCAPVTLLVICFVCMFLFRNRHYSIPVAINLMVSVSLNYTLKTTFLRQRPPIEYRAIAEAGYSFPSGHAMAAGAFYGFLIYIVACSNLSARKKRLLIGLLSLFIALVGFSRVYLGVHYLSDVVAGYAVSLAYLLVFTSLVGLYLRAGKSQPAYVRGVQKDKRFTASFLHAFSGIAGGMKSERNMMVHFAAMALVTVFGFLCNISESEWLVCIVLFGVVIGAELMNTAVETTVDICMPHRDPRAKLAKDTAAGAVLMVSLAAAVAGLIIFVPKLWPMLG